MRGNARASSSVYALFSESKSRENFIVMERIKGDRLDREWPPLSDQDKSMVASKLKSYFEELRKLPSPGVFCSLGNRPLLDTMLSTDGEPGSNVGPFATEAELNEAVVNVVQYGELPIARVL